MKVVVAGGGTAGWFTALFARQCLPDAEVTLIESEEVGILGAGEGTTPQIIQALTFLQIPIRDLIIQAEATIKHSILFSNWQGDGQSYSHGFQARQDLSFLPPEGSPMSFINATTDDSFMYQKHFDDPYEASVITMLLSTMKKSPFVERPVDLSTIQDPLHMFDKVCNFALHFNARQLAEFLKLVGTHRGVVRVEGKISQINSDETGDITSLVLEDGKKIDCDFVFDCSGFQHLIIGKHFKSEWRSFKDFLPADRALAYFKPQRSNIPAFTEAVAMKNGWSWQIPLQTRFGSGYVYSSAYTDEDEVVAEIEEREGEGVEITWGKSFKFEPGYYKDVWIRNCVAVGLSTGFLEPLEATSLMQTFVHLENIFSLRMNLLEVPKREKELISKRYASATEEIAQFLYLHYFTAREDTEFWKQFNYSAPNMPELISEILGISKYRQLVFADMQQMALAQFSVASWVTIIDGNGLISKQQYAEMYANRHFDRTQDYFSLRRNVSIEGQKCLNHSVFLSMMRRS
jgi:tryptophan halogenase